MYYPNTRCCCIPTTQTAYNEHRNKEYGNWSAFQRSHPDWHPGDWAKEAQDWYEWHPFWTGAPPFFKQ
jgi:hypothetical protein